MVEILFAITSVLGRLKEATLILQRKHKLSHLKFVLVHFLKVLNLAVDPGLSRTLRHNHFPHIVKENEGYDVQSGHATETIDTYRIDSVGHLLRCLS